MAEHRIQSPSDPSGVPSPAGPNPPVRLPREDARFTAYLDRVCFPLIGLGPEGWLPEFRAELASHLVSIAEAYEELALTPTDAADRACRQLGEPGDLSHEWVLRWEAARVEQTPFRSAFRTALASFAPSLAVSIVLLLCSVSVPDGIGDAIKILAVLCIPVFAGSRTAKRTGRPVLATLAAVTALSALTFVAGRVLPGTDPTGFRPFLGQMLLVFWLPLGAVSAGVTGWQQKRRRGEKPRPLQR